MNEKLDFMEDTFLAYRYKRSVNFNKRYTSEKYCNASRFYNLLLDLPFLEIYYLLCSL